MPALRHVDPSRTVVKVRGKTNGLRIERMGARPRRPAALRKRLAPRISSDCNSLDFAQPKQRAKEANSLRGRETLLESLPPEILHSIFEYSRNLDMPLASPQLSLSLSKSQHLQSQLTDEVLSAVVGEAGKIATRGQIMQATRLLNSKFMTWTFFTNWLCHNTTIPEVTRNRNIKMTQKAEAKERWLSLRPSPRLTPPRKLLSGPFSTATLNFLDVLAQGIHDLAGLNPLLGEIAREGLVDAVTSSNLDAVATFLGMGLQTDTELLRIAVTEGGCDHKIVQMLLTHSGAPKDMDSSASASPVDDVDLHDPMIWAWAANNGKSGEWLRNLLVEIQRLKEER